MRIDTPHSDAVTHSQRLAIAQLIVQSLRVDATHAKLGELLNETHTLDWQAFFYSADAHGVTPLIAARWENLGLLDCLPVKARARLLKARRDNAERNAIVHGEVREYWGLIAEANIPAILLKGWALAELLYAPPALRKLADTDLLVPVEHAQDGLRVLEKAGLQPLPLDRDAWVEKHLPAYWRLNGQQIVYPLANQFDPQHPRPVELHVRIWEENFRGLRLGELPHLWQRSRITEVAGVPMRVLSREDMLIHLSVHWAGHWIERSALLNSLVDLDRYMRKFNDQLDWSLIVRLGEEARVNRFVYAALEVAHRTLGTPSPSVEIWQHLSSSCPPKLRHWIARHAVDDVALMDFRDRDNGIAYVLTWLSAYVTGEKLGVLRYALLPPLEFIKARYKLKYRWLTIPYYVRYVMGKTLSYLGPFVRAVVRAKM